MSKIANENLEVFSNAWVTQINDLSVLVKDVNDVCQGKSDRQVYLSLPRPGVRRGVTCINRLFALLLLLVLCLLGRFKCLMSPLLSLLGFFFQLFVFFDHHPVRDLDFSPPDFSPES